MRKNDALLPDLSAGVFRVFARSDLPGNPFEAHVKITRAIRRPGKSCVSRGHTRRHAGPAGGRFGPAGAGGGTVSGEVEYKYRLRCGVCAHYDFESGRCKKGSGGPSQKCPFEDTRDGGG